MRLAAVLRYARPKYLWQSRAGRCPVCGRRTLFLIVDTHHIRENAWCLWCRSASRNRHTARTIVGLFQDRGVRWLKDLAAIESLRIYNMSARGCFARVWGNRPHITYSEYFDGCRSGEVREGVLCQNVEHLSFEDATFDLVGSEDVFEHVRDWQRGIREVWRVLKPGGYHVFSVPLGFGHPTFGRFGEHSGQDVPVRPLEVHGDPIRGEIPVRTSFGYDLVPLLESFGFEVRLEISRYDEARRCGTFDCATFVTRKC
jgi:SAM-dependent methyltransferase